VKDKIIPLLQELIRNRCVNNGRPDSGNETVSAKSIQAFFKSYGIESEILEAVTGRGSLLVRIPGTNPEAPSLMYMGHLDVVPANCEEWNCDPFCGDNRGGYIWGRGAIDMLNITATAAVAFAELVSRHHHFPGDFIYLAVADEEASGRLGARWLVENYWDKVKADYVITEGGGFFVDIGRNSGIAITVGEKGLAAARLLIKGKPGHGSLPYMSDNAAIKIAHAVCRINRSAPHIRLSGLYKKIVKNLNLGKWQKMNLSIPFLLPNALKNLYKQNHGLARQLHAISRMTISPNIINAGTKINIIPDSAALELDIRILPNQTVEDVINIVSRCLGKMKDDFTIEITDFFPSNVSAPTTQDSPLFKATRELIGSVYPGKKCIPMLFSGVTDGRFWRMHGATVYGFALFDEELTITEYTDKLHGVNERVSIKSLELSYNYFYRLPETFFRCAAE